MRSGLAHAACVSSPARLGAAGRGRGERIVRPGMARIAPAHLGAHRRIGAAPEAGQVARDLHRPVRRARAARSPAACVRRRSSGAGRGRTVPARGSRSSARLRPRSRSRRACRSAPRNASALRRRGGGAAARAAVAAAPRRDRRADVGERGLAGEQRREPVVDRRGERRIGRSGHSSPSAWRRNMTRSRHCVSALRPRQACRCRRARCRRRACARFRRSARPGAVCSASAIAPSRRERRARRLSDLLVERDLVAALDAVGEARLDLLQRDRRGQQDARLRGAAGQSRRPRGTARAPAARPASTLPPRPLASVNAPLPRFFAMRSG